MKVCYSYYWSTELTPTKAIKHSWKQENGPPAPFAFAFPLTLFIFRYAFWLSLLPCFTLLSVFHHASLISSFSLSFFFLSLVSLISFLLLFLKSDRSLLLNCCSDLTPTRAIKSREPTVGTWTTSGRMEGQISFFLTASISF